MATSSIDENKPQTGMPKPILTDFGLSEFVRQLDFECNKDSQGITFAFGLVYLACDSSWMESLQREYQTYLVGSRNYYIFRTSLILDGKPISAFGAGFSLDLASDASCYYLANLIKKTKRNFAMPRNLLGYPNIRGHCYLISALLPLLHCFPFVCHIFNTTYKYKRLCNFGIYHENLSERKNPESPFYWTSSIYKIYKNYRKIARNPSVSYHNVEYFLKYQLKDEDFQEYDDIPDSVKKPAADLSLDRDLIHGLCSILSTYCAGNYLTPCGDERIAYQHIVRKLAGENSGFAAKFFLRLEASFFCSSCVGGPYSGVFDLPLVHFRPDHDLKVLVGNANLLAHEQGLRCTHRTTEFHCSEPARMIHSAKILNLPLILCFGVKNANVHDGMKIPEQLTLTVEDESVSYRRLASSICFDTYKNEELKVDYRNFYHPRVDGDTKTGAHTYLHFRTDKGFVEVNDGFLFTVDPRIFQVATPCSIHFYQQEKYNEFLPTYDPETVRENPLN